MPEKSKQTRASSDYRLGKVFQFLQDDLSANKAGFMSLSQQWDVPLQARGVLFRFMNTGIAKSIAPKKRRQVLHVCGNIEVENQLRDVHDGRFQMNSNIISVPDANVRFSVNQQQAEALSAGNVYHIYYNPATMQILSLERAINGC